MLLADIIKKQKIHTRQIDIASYDAGPESILVEGVLKDKRLAISFVPTGDPTPPGMVHHMIIRMVIGGPQLVIEDIDVDMPTIPRQECMETRESLLLLKGLPIASGFMVRAKNLVGGAKGCAHLLALLTAMAPAAVQGAWAASTRQPRDPATYLPETVERAKDTCRIWRSDGPLVKKYREMIDPE